MTIATKNKVKTEQGKLPLPPGGKFKQQDITGTKTLKETAPKEVIEACEVFFSKKEDFACAQSNLDKAKERILSEMRKAKIMQVVVKDNGGIPRRIHICADEKLKIEKSTDA